MGLFLFNFLSVLIFMLYWSIVDLQYYINNVYSKKSAIRIYIFYSFSIFFFFLIWVSEYRVEFYVIQWVLVDYLYGCVCVNSKLLIYPSPQHNVVLMRNR